MKKDKVIDQLYIKQIKVRRDFDKATDYFCKTSDRLGWAKKDFIKAEKQFNELKNKLNLLNDKIKKEGLE